MIRESAFSFVRRLTTWHCPRPRRSTAVAAAARLLLTAGPPVVQQSTEISYTLRSQQQTRRCGGRTGHTDERPTVTQTLLCILCGQWQKEEMFAAIKMGGGRNVRGGNVRLAAGPGPAKRRLMSTLAALSASDQPPIGIIIATSRPLRVCLSVCLSLPLHHAAVAPAVPCSLWRSRRSLS